MYLCSDFVNYGTEKDCTDYTLEFSLEKNLLKIHTLTLRKGEKPLHRETTVSISNEEAEKLKNMKTEEERLDFIILRQAKWCA